MEAHKATCRGPLDCMWAYPGRLVQEWFSIEGTSHPAEDFAHAYVMNHRTGKGESKLLNVTQMKDTGCCFSSSLRTCYNLLHTDVRTFGTAVGVYPELDAPKILKALKKLINDTDAADEDLDHSEDNNDDDEV